MELHVLKYLRYTAEVSRATKEWAYVFKPQLAGMVLYVKLVLRSDCARTDTASSTFFGTS